jgi:hypothetical protein
MAVPSNSFRPGTSVDWWSIPRRTSIAVPAPSVGRSVWWQTKFASRKTCPDLRANRGQGSALSCRAHHHSSWLSPLLPREQMSDLRTHLSCPPQQWLDGPTTPSVRGHNCDLNCRSTHNSGLLNPSRPSEQRPEQRTHLSRPPPQ